MTFTQSYSRLVEQGLSVFLQEEEYVHLHKEKYLPLLQSQGSLSFLKMVFWRKRMLPFQIAHADISIEPISCCCWPCPPPFAQLEILIREIDSSGIVDIMAAGATMVHMSPTDGTLQGMRFFCRPMIVAHADASCTFSAMDRVAKVFSQQGLEALCRHVPFAILCEPADGAVSNERKKLFTAEQCPANCGFIGCKCGVSPSPLCDRQLHGIPHQVPSSAWKSTSVGGGIVVVGACQI